MSAASLRPPVLWRRLGNEAVLFNQATWETHLLNEDALHLLEFILDRWPDGPPQRDVVRPAVEDVLGWDCSTGDVDATLETFEAAHVIRPAHAP